MARAKRKAAKKQPVAKPAKAKRAAPKRKRGAKAATAKKTAANIFGGVAKGIAWLGNKVRGVVARKPKAKAKKKPKLKPKKAKLARKATTETSLVTLHNPLP